MPCRAGWVTYCGYRHESPYFVLSFLVLLFCVLCGVKSVMKSIFSTISAAGFSPVCVKMIVIFRAIVQS